MSASYIDCRRQWMKTLLLCIVTSQLCSADIPGESFDLFGEINSVDLNKYINSNKNKEIVRNNNNNFNNRKLMKELQDKYKVLLKNSTQLLQDIENDKIDIEESKVRIDLMEDEIMDLYKKFDNAFRGTDQNLNDYLVLLRNIVNIYKQLVDETLDKIMDLELLNIKRETDNENMFQQAMVQGNYELAAITLAGINNKTRIIELIRNIYREVKSIDGLLYLGRIVRDNNRRLLIYRNVYRFVMNRKKKDICDLFKIMYTIDKDLTEFLATRPIIFKKLYALCASVKADILLLMQELGTRTLGRGVYINNMDASFYTFKVFLSNKVLLQTIKYSIIEDSNKKGSLNCTGVKIASN